MPTEDKLTKKNELMRKDKKNREHVDGIKFTAGRFFKGTDTNVCTIVMEETIETFLIETQRLADAGGKKACRTIEKEQQRKPQNSNTNNNSNISISIGLEIALEWLDSYNEWKEAITLTDSMVMRHMQKQEPTTTQTTKVQTRRHGVQKTQLVEKLKKNPGKQWRAWQSLKPY
ncbi:hypothetical protein HELRODRAFT_160381 [Helobdella robusta]|uniref:Uncharacterized protein n=1 Tax=Helobdella robusta TaxID=6412 RepID=T1EQ64_HELRO|nr:hypothetical protein HELRODRAFT_160381 [Helobdella robusta]ESO06223.1 hypothetical protein HELRODRAFT_160381 [Helobdella robusta]